MFDPNKEKTIISVVICTKDRVEEPVTCIESVLRQTRLPDEVVVIDASATDSLREVLRESFPAPAAKLVYEQSSPGLTHQRNVSVRIARGDVVFFLDDDVVLERDYLAEILKVFEADVAGQVGGVMGRMTNARRIRWTLKLFSNVFCLSVPGDGRFRRSGLATFRSCEDGGVVPTEFLSGGLVAYHRRVLNEFPWDEALEGYGLMEDDDFSYRVSRRFRNYYVPTARCVHRASPLARDGGAALLQMRLRNHWYLFRKNFPNSIANRAAFALSVTGETLLFLYGSIQRLLR
jgi:GT2 family glycosyltransferase